MRVLLVGANYLIAEATVQALMTVVAILTQLPLALAIGQGLAMQLPLTIITISGQLFWVPLVLVVLPALYHIFAGEQRARQKEAE